MKTREITTKELKQLKSYACEQTAYLWGHKYKTTPTIISVVFGDGGSLISLEPTNSRPDYYIMLADSSIKSFEDAIHFISENEELVFQAIEEEYGNADEDDEDNHVDGQMPLNISSGYTAGYYHNFK
jgi:hypothetical protein